MSELSGAARTGDAFAPRQITAARPRLAVLFSCIAVLVLVSVVEIAVPNSRIDEIVAAFPDFEWDVVACFVKRNHKTVRYVIEHDDGVLHIASERQLRLAMPKSPGAT